MIEANIIVIALISIALLISILRFIFAEEIYTKILTTNLIGTKIDYIEDIMGSRFDFQNSMIDSKCGCGTSINFKENVR